MSIDDDLAVIAEQERLLVFRSFDGGDAWRVGGLVRELALPLGAVTIEVQVAGHVLLRHAMPGAAPITADWARRKGATALRFHKSSYAVGLALGRDGATLESKYGLPPSEFAVHGGAVPIRIAGTGVVGVAVISGLPQRLDHALVVKALARTLGVDVPEFADV